MRAVLSRASMIAAMSGPALVRSDCWPVPRCAVGRAPATVGGGVGAAAVHVSDGTGAGSADREASESRTGVPAGGAGIGAATGSADWTCRAGVSTGVFGRVTAGPGCGGVADARAARSCGDDIDLGSRAWLGVGAASVSRASVPAWVVRAMPAFGFGGDEACVSAWAPSVVARYARPASVGAGDACVEAGSGTWSRLWAAGSSQAIVSRDDGLGSAVGGPAAGSLDGGI